MRNGRIICIAIFVKIAPFKSKRFLHNIVLLLRRVQSISSTSNLSQFILPSFARVHSVWRLASVGARWIPTREIDSTYISVVKERLCACIHACASENLSSLCATSNNPLGTLNTNGQIYTYASVYTPSGRYRVGLSGMIGERRGRVEFSRVISRRRW